MTKHILIIMVVLATYPGTSKATALVTSSLMIDWSSLNISYTNGLSVDWETDPFVSGEDLTLFDQETNGSIWREEHSPNFNFTAVGQGVMWVDIDYESSISAHTDYIDERVSIYQNFEMWISTDSAIEFSESPHQIDNWFPLSPVPFNDAWSVTGTLTCGIWLNEGDAGMLKVWIHNEINASSATPIPEPATLFLLSTGLLVLGSATYRKKERLSF